MRKLLLLILTTALLLSLCACGGSQAQDATPDSTEPAPSATVPATTEATIPTTATPTDPETLPATEPTEDTHTHEFVDGSCVSCGEKDPTSVQERMVWIPTKGGTKFHITSTCSNMEDPRYVTYTEAINSGFTACMKCYR